MAMLLIAAAALAIVSPPPSPTSATVQATATIRIVAAVRLKLDAPENPGAPPPRDSLVKASDGTMRPAKLIEFP
jgi:hypothetical protein